MNKRLTDIMKLARIELLIIPVFVLFKFIRPRLLQSTSSGFIKVILLSLPAKVKSGSKNKPLYDAEKAQKYWGQKIIEIQAKMKRIENDLKA